MQRRFEMKKLGEVSGVWAKNRRKEYDDDVLSENIVVL